MVKLPIFYRGGTLWRHSEKQSPTTFGIGNVPDCLLKKMPSFGRSSPKTLGNVPEFFPSPQIHSGTFPNFFREADFGGNPRQQPPKTLGNVPDFFREADFRKTNLSSPQKHSGTFPNFFSGRLTLGETLGSSPQKHSGTFPIFFSGG